jgi:uncharacterized protein YjbI with pentapeptide repeats
MSEEGKKEENKQERRFSQEQYDMLNRCSEKKDMTEWNEWRKENPEEDVLLEGANIAQARRVSPEQEVFKTAYLREANLSGGHLERADLRGAHLEKANFIRAHLEEAKLGCAHLEDAWFSEVHLENANLLAAHLNAANLMFADLEGAILNSAHLEGADFNFTDLRGAYFRYTHLKGAHFGQAIVDGFTSLWECEVDHNTDFSGVGLDSIKIDPATKQLLEYNIRRKNWEEWYPKQNRLLRWIVSAFWWVSNYGISTPRIIKVFLVSAVAFASFYYLWGIIAPPGIVDYLFVDGKGVEVVWWLVPVRAIHFSVVVMTVGFTNMHANAHSFWGHILVGLQMILGFVLLGALVTRFAVLFTAGGPAGKFAEEKKEENQNEETGE